MTNTIQPFVYLFTPKLFILSVLLFLLDFGHFHERSRDILQEQTHEWREKALCSIGLHPDIKQWVPLPGVVICRSHEATFCNSGLVLLVLLRHQESFL